MTPCFPISRCSRADDSVDLLTALSICFLARNWGRSVEVPVRTDPILWPTLPASDLRRHSPVTRDANNIHIRLIAPLKDLQAQVRHAIEISRMPEPSAAWAACWHP